MEGTTKHTGSCHCGKVRYEVEGDFSKGIECNCSMCARKGSILSFVPATKFKLLSGEDSLTDYQFNKHVIHHLFCSTCGVTSFARGQMPDGSPMVAVNVRTLEDFDLGKVSRQMYDGKSH